MDVTTKEQCATCRHWMPDGGDRGSFNGRCRRHPPITGVVCTGATELCGEWQAQFTPSEKPAHGDIGQWCKGSRWIPWYAVARNAADAVRGMCWYRLRGHAKPAPMPGFCCGYRIYSPGSGAHIPHERIESYMPVNFTPPELP